MKKKVFRERYSEAETPLRNKGETTDAFEFLKIEPIKETGIYFEDKEGIKEPKKRGRKKSVK